MQDDRWPRVRIGFALVAALGTLGTGLLGVSSGDPAYIVAAGAFAVVAVGYGVAALVRRDGAFPTGWLIPTAVASVLFMGGTGYLTVSSCDNQIDTGADLSGCDFAGEDLSDEDLTGANLSEADLSEANLSNADFTDADLSRANLSEATVGGASFVGATLEETDLSGLDLAGLSFVGADLSGADLTDASLVDASFGGADLTGASLAGADASRADLGRATLNDADLSGAVLAQADMGSATLTGANLGDADLTKARLSGAELDSASLDGADLTGATLSGADLDGVSLDDAVLDQVSMVDVSGLDDADLAAALDVDEDDLAETLIEHKVLVQDRDDVLAELGPACRGNGLAEATPFEGGGLHPLVLLEANGSPGAFTNRVSKQWEPPAARFGQLVACVQPEKRDIVEVCSYFSLDTGAPTAPVTRYRPRRSVELVEAKTGRLVDERTFTGGEPPVCQFQVFGAYDQSLEGNSVPFVVIERWLRPKVR